MRIAFAWDGITEHYGKRFKDGLWAALKILEEKHSIGYFEPTAEQAIKEFKPDILLWWGALCEAVRSKVVSYPYKKAICFGGGPITESNVHGFDLYFTESKINEDEFARFGKPFLRAFGVNENIWRPIQSEKIYDGAIWATFALWKRHNLFADAVGEKGLAIGRFQDHEKQCYEWCKEKGMKVFNELPPEEAVKHVNQSHAAVNTSAFWGGGQRMTLEAMACNIPVIVMSDSPKNCEYVLESGWGEVVEPNPRHIQDAMKKWKGQICNSRNYILSKWSSRHYAEALEKGLSQL